MTHLLTWLPSWIFLVKASQLSLPNFIREHLMQQVGCSVVPGWPAQHICSSGVYLWCQDDLPNTYAAGGLFCGARMTCPTHLQQWCLSVVPGWPAQHICSSGVYLLCQDDVPNTFSAVVSICCAKMTCPTHLQQWCLSIVPGWPAQHISSSGVYLWCQDDLPNIFAAVVSIHLYIHSVNGNGNHFLLVC